MHDQIPTREPLKLIAGDSWQWDKSVAGHLASDGWALTYYFAGPESFHVTAAADGDNFSVRVPGAQTIHKPGSYRIIGRVSKDTDRFTVFEGEVFVEPDPTASKSFAARMVEKIEAELEARFGTNGNVRRWEQGDRSEELAEEQQLREQLGYYREQIRVERGGPVFLPVQARFGRS